MTTGDCKCWVHGRPSMVFYNRVPKCGSTTMLDYIDAASKMQGFDEKGHRRAFAYIRSNDYDANQFMDVHNNDGSGFWAKVCPTVSPPDICECSWKVVADSNCYDA